MEAIWAGVGGGLVVLYLAASVYALAGVVDKASRRGVRFYERRPMLSGTPLQLFGDGLVMILAVVLSPIACVVISRMRAPGGR